MSAQYTFIHGWGMGSGVWGITSQYFPFEQSNFIDLGFLYRFTPKTINSAKKSIYITHSLGALWALKNCAEDIEALIIINGFTNFTNFVDERVLRTMQKRLMRDPRAQMQEFWGNIGLEKPLRQALDEDKLHEGLDWLINWDINAELKSLNAPILSLAGGQDPLLPLDKIKQEWAGVDLIIKEDGGHLLPLNEAEWCAEQIKEFLVKNELEK